MIQNHIRCDICAKDNVIRWFKNEDELRTHNQTEHYICTYPGCSAQGMIAFATRGELLIHMQAVHHDHSVNIDFTTDFASPAHQASQDDPQKKARELREANARFIAKLNEVFQGNTQVINQLKAQARNLIQGNSTPAEFYRRFAEICGDKKNQIFNDMIAILPDPRLRVALMKLHERPPEDPPKPRQVRIEKPPRQESPRAKKPPPFHMTKSQSQEAVSADHEDVEPPAPIDVGPHGQQAPGSGRGGPGRRGKKKKTVVVYAM